jgi:hypothetical protein
MAANRQGIPNIKYEFFASTIAEKRGAKVREWVPYGGRKFGQPRYACRNAIKLSVAARSAHLCPIFQGF